MNKKLLIAIPVSFLLLVGVIAGFFFFNKSDEQKPSKEALIAHNVKLIEIEIRNEIEEQELEWLECVYEGIYDELPDRFFIEVMKEELPINELEDLYLTKDELRYYGKVATQCSEKISEPEEDLSEVYAGQARTVLRNAITGVRATQTGLGDSDFSGINREVLAQNEPDIIWIDSELTDGDPVFTVAILKLSVDQIVLQSTDSQICYFTEINADGPTRYGTAQFTDERKCPSTVGGSGGNDFVPDNIKGWETL